MKRIAAFLVVAALVVAACSDDPQLAPTPDRDPQVSEPREPQVYASGTAMAGDDGTTPIRWDLEEIVGFTHAVSLTAATPTSIIVRSASRQGVSDAVWLVGTELTPDGPPVVFGGADDAIDSVVVINELGEELPVELIDVPEVDWSLAIEELPSDWSAASGAHLEVVATTSGEELARESLPGFDQ